MSSSFEKSVKGGTKVKLAPPKSKYVEHILLATQSGEAGVAEVFRTLTHRLRDSTWTVAFKSLIIVHLMIKEGAPNVTLSYLSAAPTHRLAINSFTDVQTQGHNIRRYSEYLLARAQAFEAAKCDFVAEGQAHVKRLSVDKGLLRETEIIQMQVRALVKCNMLDNDLENEISLTAFRLLTRDLLDLYAAENEAVMNVLGHYFEMSKPDAERAIKIYKTFCKQTDLVVQFLGVARQFEHATRLEIPKIKHAPTSLAASLQEYLDDKEFDINRRQYLAEQEAKKSGKPFSKPAAQKSSQPASSKPNDTAPAPAAAAQAKGPAPDLIDFFDSIEQKQQPMAQQVQQYPQQQQQGFVTAQQTSFGAPQLGFQQPMQGFPQQSQQPTNGFMGNDASTNPFMQQQQQQQQQPMNGFDQSTNPFGQPQQQAMPQQQQQLQPVQTNYTGAGFGGYGPQPQQQSFTSGGAFPQDTQQAFGNPAPQAPAQAPAQLQAQQTNPFRLSMMATGSSMGAFGGQSSTDNTGGLQRQSTNPFAKHTQQQTPSFQVQSIPEDGNAQNQPQSSSPFGQQQQQQPTGLQPLQSQATGTNPFARPQTATSQQQQNLSPLSVQATGTNPFRQSMFMNQQTGQGWQNAPQATMGGFEQMNTVPVFPRPGTSQPQQQQSPWG
ncbi:hypothetical protein WHR41_03384 [Cladosporium halotolerans]|uniref:ENTH domain-containing protein n=1 Tax=Cladosporium halotolerans TaxID=1052096 RepID=A0AB34KUF5_9PEZI